MDRIDMASAHPAPFGFGIADVALPAPAFTLPRQVADDLDLTVEPNVESTIPQITNGVLWKIVLETRGVSAGTTAILLPGIADRRPADLTLRIATSP